MKENDDCIITAIIDIVGAAAFKIGIGVDLPPSKCKFKVAVGDRLIKKQSKIELVHAVHGQ